MTRVINGWWDRGSRTQWVEPSANKALKPPAWEQAVPSARWLPGSVEVRSSGLVQDGVFGFDDEQGLGGEVSHLGKLHLGVGFKRMVGERTVACGSRGGTKAPDKQRPASFAEAPYLAGLSGLIEPRPVIESLLTEVRQSAHANSKAAGLSYR